jgi:hypothetical protein
MHLMKTFIVVPVGIACSEPTLVALHAADWFGLELQELSGIMQFPHV